MYEGVLAVACIKKYEGLHGPKHHPYVGYGHKLLPGERLSPRMTERQADALLRSDLRKLCAMFRGFGRDSLLLAALAYNVGCGQVMRSRIYAKMRSGNRNIYRDYVDFKRWNGKIVPSIERRRKMEYLLLFTPSLHSNLAKWQTFPLSWRKTHVLWMKWLFRGNMA